MLPPREPDSRLTATVSAAGTPEAPASARRSPRKPWCGDSRSACPLSSCSSPRFERCSGIVLRGRFPPLSPEGRGEQEGGGRRPSPAARLYYTFLKRTDEALTQIQVLGARED